MRVWTQDGGGPIRLGGHGTGGGPRLATAAAGTMNNNNDAAVNNNNLAGGGGASGGNGAAAAVQPPPPPRLPANASVRRMGGFSFGGFQFRFGLVVATHPAGPPPQQQQRQRQPRQQQPSTPARNPTQPSTQGPEVTRTADTASASVSPSAGNNIYNIFSLRTGVRPVEF